MRRNKILSKIPGALPGTLFIFLIFSITGDKFFTAYNLLNLAKNSAILLIASIGMTLAILIGCIDISVGAIMSFSGVVTMQLMQSGIPLLPALFAGIVTGMLCGAINGLFVSYLKVDYWIATFAMMSLAQGLSLVISGGNTVAGGNQAFRFLGNGKILGIYCSVWIAFILIPIMIYFIKSTKTGYHLYAIGDSENCAFFSGLPVKKLKFTVYLLSGLFAGIAGILLAAKTNSAAPTGGLGYEFDAIAAVLIGGTSFGGGIGGLTGTVVGALLICILRNGLSMAGFSVLWQYVLIGVIILAIIIADVTKTKLQKRGERP